MKLAALGVVTAGIGVALAVPGLIGVGLFWVLMGLVARAQARRLQQSGAEPGAHGAAAGTAPGTGRTGSLTRPARVADGRTFALGTALWLGIGLPSLAVGLFELGIDADHADWRWLPIAVGGLALAIGVLGAVLYGAGSAVTAVAERDGVPEKPATLWIRKVTETGTFVNERPRLEFVFEVEPDATAGFTPYEVTKKATVPFTAMGSLRVGDGFKALVAGPEKPTSMTIDWDSSVSAATPVAAAASSAGTISPSDVSTRLDELDRLRREAKITDEEYQAQRQRILGSL